MHRAWVGSEVLTEADFAAVEDAQVGLARVLLELGPFFVEAVEQGANAPKGSA